MFGGKLFVEHGVDVVTYVCL